MKKCWKCLRTEDEIEGGLVEDYTEQEITYYKCNGSCKPYSKEEKVKYFKGWYLTPEQIEKWVPRDLRHIASEIRKHKFSLCRVDTYSQDTYWGTARMATFDFVYTADALHCKKQLFNNTGDMDTRRRKVLGHVCQLTIRANDVLRIFEEDEE